jgi:integrase
MARGTIVTRTQKNGKNRYATVIRVAGKQQWKTFARKKEAEDYLDRHSTDLRDGTYREIRKATFSAYATHWKAVYLIPQNLKPATLDGYRSALKKHLEPEFGAMAMQAISSAEINAFRAKLQQQELGSKTIRNILNLLNRFFRDAIADKYLRHSPMTGIDKPKMSRKKKGRALNPAEIQALLNACDTPEARLIILTAILTGMRRSEIFGLRWQDIDWDHDVIQVRQALYWLTGRQRPAEGEPYAFVTPKSETSIREIDLSPALKKELGAVFDRQSTVTVLAAGQVITTPPAGLVFAAEDGRPQNPALFYSHAFRYAVIAAGIGKVRFHDCRHTFGSLKLEQGENIYYVQRQMGHSSIQVTIDTYGHMLESRKPAAAARTDAFVFGAR